MEVIFVFLTMLLTGLIKKDYFAATRQFQNTPSEKLQLIEPKSERISQEDYVNQAITHLQLDLGISREEISVVEVEAQKYSDTSLGCPQKDQVYSQVITQGYKIILAVYGIQYDYRVGLNRVLLCRSS